MLLPRLLEGRCGSRIAGQAGTYLPHLMESTIIHAELLEVILRRRDHPVDDLLVDGALHVAVSGLVSPLRRLVQRRAQGQLTTIVFDIAAPSQLLQLSIV